MPATPKQMLVAALISASMDPLGIAVAALRGREVPSAMQTLVLFLPTYACALAAVVPVTILHRLGRRLRHARDLGSYHLERLLGRGGMGEVWLGRHQLLARSAAVKLVRPEVLGAGTDAAAAVMLRRFEREAQATAALELTALDPALRLRRHRRPHLLLRDGAAGRPRPRNAGAGVRTAAGRPCPVRAAPGVPLARRGARARPGAPRRHAGQHLSVPDGPRLRLRQGPRLRPGEVQRPAGHRADADGRHARDRRHAGLHGPRADCRRGRGRGAPTCIPSAASPITCSPGSWSSRPTPP